jgi:hypothetical protein
MIMLKKLLLTTVSLIFAAGAALAISGNQIGFPIVGGGSYCASYGNAGVCNFTVGAGPTSVTGNETIVANTNLANGQNPQTVLMTLASLGALPYQYLAITTTGGSTTVLPTSGTLLLDPTGTVAAWTVVLPASTALADGQIIRVTSSQTITSLTVTAGAGTTIAGTAVSALTPSGTSSTGYEYIYDQPLTKWYRVQ